MAQEAYLAELVKYDAERTEAESKSMPRTLYTHGAVGLVVGLVGLLLFISLKRGMMLAASLAGFAYFAWTFFEITMMEHNSEPDVQPKAANVNYHLFREPARPHQVLPRAVGKVLAFPVKKSSGPDYERKLAFDVLIQNPGLRLEDAYGKYKEHGGTEAYETYLEHLRTLRSRGLIKIKKVAETQ